MTPSPRPSSYLVVGLGNPGSRYSATRHNLGRMVLEDLASRTPSTSFSVHKRSNAEVATCHPVPAGTSLLLVRPRSFMNLSGGPVRALADYYRVPASGIVVIYDDLELPFGNVQARQPSSGDRGHNGLKSVSSALGTRGYHRVAVGIGRPPGKMAAADYVLRPLSKAEKEALPPTLAEAADAVERIAGIR